MIDAKIEADMMRDVTTMEEMADRAGAPSDDLARAATEYLQPKARCMTCGTRRTRAAGACRCSTRSYRGDEGGEPMSDGFTEATVACDSGEWAARHHEDGSWVLIGPQGLLRVRGHFANAMQMGLHLAMVVDDNDRLRAEVERLKRFEAAVASLAAQVCSPATTPQQMCDDILGERTDTKRRAAR